jgi:PAS domain S-box-containing protein
MQRRLASGIAQGQAMAVEADTAREGKIRTDALHAHLDHLEARLVSQVRGLSLDITQRSQDARALAIRTALALFLAIAFMAAVTARGYRTAAERNAALSREITERQHAEATARASEARFAAFLNGISEALVITDDHGRIAWTNQRLPELFGYAPEELQGGAVAMLLAHPELQRLEAQLSTLRAGSAERVAFEASARSADGREFPVEIAMSRFDVTQGTRIALVIRDVSERKAVDRMKSEFIASVSHELRTPLTAIMGSLALLREGDLGELPAGMGEFVDMAHANSQRLARLVDDVIDIERIGSGALAFRAELFALPAFLEEVEQLNRGYADTHGVSIRLELPVPHVQLRADRSRLMQAITNLVSNACKFSPRGQAVSVAARMAGNRIRFSVTDRGPGIPEAFRPRVFEKFAQADSSDSRQSGGTGLGLAIARAIVVRLGGTIGFETQTGSGTTFWVEMPVVDARATAGS